MGIPTEVIYRFGDFTPNFSAENSQSAEMDIVIDEKFVNLSDKIRTCLNPEEEIRRLIGFLVEEMKQYGLGELICDEQEVMYRFNENPFLITKITLKTGANLSFEPSYGGIENGGQFRMNNISNAKEMLVLYWLFNAYSDTVYLLGKNFTKEPEYII